MNSIPTGGYWDSILPHVVTGMGATGTRFSHQDDAIDASLYRICGNSSYYSTL